MCEGDREGFKRGRNLDKVGLKAQDTSELFFDNVKLPISNLIGAEGKGFYNLMEQLPQERLAIAVAAVSASEAALDWTIEYVNERNAFGKKIAEFQNTKFKLAELKTELSVAQIYIDECISKHLNNDFDAVEGAMAKLWTTELQCKLVDECVQLHGGYGYMREYPIARSWEDARVQRIYGGTNEIMKEIISRTLSK
jgi:acyl-CoA dehydrogenase